MNKYLSNKINFFSFWLIVLVVILHSLNVEFTTCDNLICSFQYLVSHKLAQIAVPLFFFISGYLYFLKTDINKKIDFHFFIIGTKKRLKTIVLPYLIWCVFWFLFMYAVQYLPVIKNYFTEPLHTMALKDKILNLIYYPLNYPFWFLRELMMLFVIAPLLFLLVKHLKIMFVFGLVLIVLFFSKIIEVNGFTILQSIPLFFFSLGAFFSLNKMNITFNPQKTIAVLLMVFWIGFNVISVYAEKYSFFDETVIRGFNVFKDCLGCVTVWYLYDLYNRERQWKNYSFYNYSFFIFAFHGIPTLVFIKISNVLCQGNPYYLFLAYLLIFISVIVMSIFTAKGTKKLFPKAYNLMIGYRE